MRINIPQKVLDDERLLVDEGRILARIESVEDDDDHFSLNYTILAHDSSPSMVGKKTSIRFPASGPALWVTGSLVKRMGLVQRGTPVEEADFDTQDLTGMVIVTDIEHRSAKAKNGDTYYVTNWTGAKQWPVDHPDVKEWVAQHYHPADSGQNTTANIVDEVF